METRLLFIFLLTSHLASGVLSVPFTFKNNCPDTIWPATLTGGGPGTPQLSTTGFQLNPGESKPIDVPRKWSSGRFWARTHCTEVGGKFKCATGDCASDQVACNGAGGIPPVTLVEVTLEGGYDLDNYDISIVDGYNLPISITPQAGDNCRSSTCGTDINAICPARLRKESNGATVACQSACEAFNDDRHCCRGAFDTEPTCPPTDFSKFFKDACPEAYSYAYDDRTSLPTCATGASANYLITFCP